MKPLYNLSQQPTMRAACKDNCKFFGQTLLTCVISNQSAISFYFLHCTNETRGMQAHVMSGTASSLETCKHDFSVWKYFLKCRNLAFWSKTLNICPKFGSIAKGICLRNIRNIANMTMKKAFACMCFLVVACQSYLKLTIVIFNCLLSNLIWQIAP